FAPRAFKVQVDIDAAELGKPTVRADIGIHADLKFFLTELALACNRSNYQPKHENWLRWCRERVARYPVVNDRQRTSSTPMNSYHFIEQLSEMLSDEDVVI